MPHAERAADPRRTPFRDIQNDTPREMTVIRIAADSVDLQTSMVELNST